MKDHYDFTNAVQGKHTRPIEELKVPIYLDPAVEKGLQELSLVSGKEIGVLANALLQKDLELLKAIT